MVCILCTTWCSWRTVCRKEQDSEFALINQRQSSNLGFWTIHVEQSHKRFFEKILPIYNILVEFHKCDTLPYRAIYVGMPIHLFSSRYCYWSHCWNTRKGFQVITDLVTVQLLHYNRFLFLWTWCWKGTELVEQSANISHIATRTLFLQTYKHLRCWQSAVHLCLWSVLYRDHSVKSIIVKSPQRRTIEYNCYDDFAS